MFVGTTSNNLRQTGSVVREMKILTLDMFIKFKSQIFLGNYLK